MNRVYLTVNITKEDIGEGKETRGKATHYQTKDSPEEPLLLWSFSLLAAARVSDGS